MKSSVTQLKSRGKITLEDAKDNDNQSKIELLEMIKSKEAYKRTIAIRLLSERNELDDDLIYFFLHTLTQEKKLYTKIELCDALSKGGIQSAKIMVKYLGQIGNNQHKELPTNTFNKKSYPLPRDIIARTLAYMKEDIIPELLSVLKTNNLLAIREVIDTIGFICFYNKIHSTAQVINPLMLSFKDHLNDDVTRWKLVRAFESFNNTDIIKTLMDIEQNDNQPLIRNEAKRSLMIIKERTK